MFKALGCLQHAVEQFNRREGEAATLFLRCEVVVSRRVDVAVKLH
jgi:hypothetical protein